MRGLPTPTRCAAVAIAIWIAAGTPAGGQALRRELVGKVRDSTGAPIPGAVVELGTLAARTDASGRFRLSTPDIDTVSLLVRRLGYAPEIAHVTARNHQWDTVVVELSLNPQTLDAVRVKDAPVRMRAFEERRARGIGVFVTREEIAERNTTLPSDVLRTKRGIHLVRLRNGSYGVRFAMFSSSRPNCVPALWIDGQRARNMEIDDLSAGDIEGIELYDSFSITPFEFSRDSELPCGTIVVWTRVPGK
jgi:hypothetical protein